MKPLPASILLDLVLTVTAVAQSSPWIYEHDPSIALHFPGYSIYLAQGHGDAYNRGPTIFVPDQTTEVMLQRADGPAIDNANWAEITCVRGRERAKVRLRVGRWENPPPGTMQWPATWLPVIMPYNRIERVEVRLYHNERLVGKYNLLTFRDGTVESGGKK